MKRFVLYDDLMCEKELKEIGVTEATVITIFGYKRIFNLEQLNDKYPIIGNYKAILNLIPSSQGYFFNGLIVTLKDDNSFNVIMAKKKKSHKLAKIGITTEDEGLIECFTFISSITHNSDSIYPIPEYYENVKNIAKNISKNTSSKFYDDFMNTTFVNMKGNMIDLNYYDKTFRDVNKYNYNQENYEVNCMNIDNISFNFYRDRVLTEDTYILEDDGYIKNHAMMLSKHNGFLNLLLKTNKIKFMKTNMLNETPLIWLELEKKSIYHNLIGIFADTRHIHIHKKEPIIIVLDMNIVDNINILNDVLQNILFNVINVKTIGYYDIYIEMIHESFQYNNYHEIFKRTITLKRGINEDSLIPKSIKSDWALSNMTAISDIMVPTYKHLSMFIGNIIIRRELVEFPSIDHKCYVWFYSKYDKSSEKFITFAKYEENVEYDIVLSLHKELPKTTKFESEIIDGTPINYLSGKYRNYIISKNEHIIKNDVDKADYKGVNFV